MSVQPNRGNTVNLIGRNERMIPVAALDTLEDQLPPDWVDTHAIPAIPVADMREAWTLGLSIITYSRPFDADNWKHILIADFPGES